MTTTYFKETAVSKRGWTILLALCAIAWGCFFVIDNSQKAFFLGGTLVVMIGGIAALTMFSMNYYGNIVVSDEALRVGRDSVPLADLDPADVSAVVGCSTPGLGARLEAAGTVQLPGQSEASGGGRLLGGAYAAPLGKQLVPLRQRGTGPIIVPTKDAEGLLEGLLSALAARPDRVR